MPEGARLRPYCVGLTGSIGMGKTETGKLFARLGIPVLDADAVVRELYQPGGAAVAPVAAVFPAAMRDGRIDRAVLSKLLTDDPLAFGVLESVVHPLVRKVQEDFVRVAAERGDELVMLEIPLLFETGSEQAVDATVVVSAPPQVQESRVLARKGMTPDKLRLLLARQIPDAEKRAKADFIIETRHGVAQAFCEVKRVAAELIRRARMRSAHA